MVKNDMNGSIPSCLMNHVELQTMKAGFTNMERQVEQLHSRLEPLEYLPRIATTLETLTSKLVKPATDKTFLLIVMGGLLIMLVVLVLKDSDKSFKLNGSGFEMENHGNPYR